MESFKLFVEDYNLSLGQIMPFVMKAQESPHDENTPLVLADFLEDLNDPELTILARQIRDLISDEPLEGWTGSNEQKNQLLNISNKLRKKIFNDFRKIFGDDAAIEIGDKDISWHDFRDNWQSIDMGHNNLLWTDTLGKTKSAQEFIKTYPGLEDALARFLLYTIVRREIYSHSHQIKNRSARLVLSSLNDLINKLYRFRDINEKNTKNIEKLFKQAKELNIPENKIMSVARFLEDILNLVLERSRFGDTNLEQDPNFIKLRAISDQYS